MCVIKKNKHYNARRRVETKPPNYCPNLASTNPLSGCLYLPVASVFFEPSETKDFTAFLTLCGRLWYILHFLLETVYTSLFVGCTFCGTQSLNISCKIVQVQTCQLGLKSADLFLVWFRLMGIFPCRFDRPIRVPLGRFCTPLEEILKTTSVLVISARNLLFQKSFACTAQQICTWIFLVLW